MPGEQPTLVSLVRGIAPHGVAGQLTLVRHGDAFVVLDVEDLRGGERQRVPSDVRVHLTSDFDVSRRPATPHLGGQALAEAVDDALDTSADTADTRVPAVDEEREPRVGAWGFRLRDGLHPRIEPAVAPTSRGRGIHWALSSPAGTV